jgi:hypothetical protein
MVKIIKIMSKQVNDYLNGCDVNGYDVSSLCSKLLSALFFTAILTSSAFIMPAKADPMSGTYIIGPEGDYTTLSDAIEDIRSRRVDGEIILEVEPGTYNESLDIHNILLPNNFTSSHGFTIRSSTGNAEDVVLTAGGSTVEAVVSIHANNRNFTFENFTIQSTDFNTRGVLTEGNNHQFRDMIFIGSGISRGRYSNGLRIENCVFQGASITLLGQNLRNVHITGNTFRNGSIQINTLRGAYTISDNVIIARRTGILIQNAPVNGRIFNNYILVENELHGREGLFLHTVDSVLVYHNTLKTLRGTPFRVSGEANIHLKNNILFATNDYVADLEFHGSVTSDYNGYYTSRDDVARIGEFREWDVYETFEDFRSATGQDSNSVFSDPLFDFEEEDEILRLKPATTVFETAGYNLHEVVPEDLLGNPRPDTPSLGALEYIGTETPVSNSELYELPPKFTLLGNYPNPFNPSTTISYDLREETEIMLVVFDTNGRRIATLVSERQTAGNHTIAFNASNLASGVYLYRLSTPEQAFTGKMILVK